MEEHRNRARGRTLIGARVVFNGRSSTMDCVVRNQSAEGCLLAFAHQPTIPDEIEIAIGSDPALRPARVVWRKDGRAGVVFTDGLAKAG